MEITVVIGPPCAGKSTYVEAHANPDDVIIDFDKIARALGSSTPHLARGAVAEVAFAARKAAIATALDGIDAPTWIIHTQPSIADTATYEQHGATITVLDPGIEVCLDRAITDDRPAETAAAIEQWYARNSKSASRGYFAMKSWR